VEGGIEMKLVYPLALITLFGMCVFDLSAQTTWGRYQLGTGIGSLVLTPSKYDPYYNNPMTVKVWTPRGYVHYTVVTRRTAGRTYRTFFYPMVPQDRIVPNLAPQQPTPFTIPADYYQVQPKIKKPQVGTISERKPSLIPGISNAKLRRIISKPRG
jgi:hypothetical protein